MAAVPPVATSSRSVTAESESPSIDDPGVVDPCGRLRGVSREGAVETDPSERSKTVWYPFRCPAHSIAWLPGCGRVSTPGGDRFGLAIHFDDDLVLDSPADGIPDRRVFLRPLDEFLEAF